MHTNLNYDSRIKTCWNIILAVVVFAVIPHLSYRLTFNFNRPDGWYWLLIGIYWMDILFGFTVSVRSKLKHYTSFKEIAGHYFSTWFFIDLVASIPYEFIFRFAPQPAPGETMAAVVTIARLLFLLKVLKVPLVLSQVQDNLFLNPVAMRLIKFCFFFSHAVHYMALGWIIIGASEAYRPFFDQYLRSFYWCVTTVATIGYGDYFPNHNSNLQIFYIFSLHFEIFGI